MKFFVIVLGLAMAAIGGQAVWTGYDIVEIERGWSAVIAGSTVFASGLITIAIGFLMWRVDALRRAVLSLRPDEERLPKEVEIPLGAGAVRAAAPVLAPRASEPVVAPPEIPAAVRAMMSAPMAVPPPAPAPMAVPPVAPALVAVPSVAPELVTIPSPALPPSFLARSNVAPLPTRGERSNRASPSVVAADESPGSDRESGATPSVPSAAVALETPGEPSPPPTKPVAKAPIIWPRRVDRIVMPKRRSNGGRELAAQDEAAAEPNVSTLPRSPPFSRGIWPERPSLVAARRPAPKPAVRPLDEPPPQTERAPQTEQALGQTEQAPRQAEQAPGQAEQAPHRNDDAPAAPRIGMHDWLERALAGDESAKRADVAAAPPVAVEQPDIPPIEAASAEQADATTEATSEVTAAPADPPPDVSSPLEQAVTPVARYEAHGTTYVMYTDGSIEAESNSGHHHFASIVELKQFIEEQGQE